MKLTAEQKGYIAGMIDGEGCLYLNPRDHKSGYYAILNIANTDERVMLYIQSLIGGTLHKIKTQEGWKDRYCLMCHANVLRELLPQILPLLVIKKEQGILIMRFLNLFKNKGPLRKFNGERVEIQRIFGKCIKSLNRRGTREADEFRENLSHETILSQALQEIEEKVQRLEAEAKDRDNSTIQNAIDKFGHLGKTVVQRNLSSRLRPIYVSNASTSVRPERDDIVRATQ